jgi:hypothetical protein
VQFRFRLGGTGATPIAAEDREFDPEPFRAIDAKLRSILELGTPTTVSQRIAGWGY